MGEEGEKREEEEEEEEEDGGVKIKQSQGMELWIFGIETNLDHGIEWIYGTLRHLYG